MRRKARESSTSEWTSAYETLRPVFFRVLWRLAGQGYVSDAGQGMDLIHDFFAEAWPGLAQRYDPSLASLKVYAAAAFARFARPRLVREARWLGMLGDDQIPAQTSSDEPSLAVDRDRVRAVLAQLDPEDRRILGARFGSDSISERRLAQDVGMTRYKYRERLAAAMARFAAVLGEAGAMEPQDFEVARLIFGAGQSVDQVAAKLSLPATQVRSARRRILRTLGSAAVEASI